MFMQNTLLLLISALVCSCSAKSTRTKVNEATSVSNPIANDSSTVSKRLNRGIYAFDMFIEKVDNFDQFAMDFQCPDHYQTLIVKEPNVIKCIDTSTKEHLVTITMPSNSCPSLGNMELFGGQLG
eukprot:Pgem_evm1s9720